MTCCFPCKGQTNRQTLHSISLTHDLHRKTNTVTEEKAEEELESYSTKLLSDYISNICDKDFKSIERDFNTINDKLTSSWFSTEIIVNQSFETLDVPLYSVGFESAAFFIAQLTTLKVPQKSIHRIKQTVQDQTDVINEIEDKQSFLNLSHTFYCDLTDETSQIGLIIYGFVPCQNSANVESKSDSNDKEIRLICCGHCEEWNCSNFKTLPLSNNHSKTRLRIKNYLIYQLLESFGVVSDGIAKQSIDIRNIDPQMFDRNMSRQDIVELLGLDSYPIYNTDENGYLQFDKGLFIKKQFVLCSELGKGAYSKVFEAIDVDKQQKCAMKVIRNIEPFIRASKAELDILNAVTNNDFCIQLQGHFVWKKHCCLVFPMYGPNILDLMEQNKYKPFPDFIVRSLVYQICKAIQFIHSIGIVFTDLKPENILFESAQTYLFSIDHKTDILVPCNSKIKIIDFGSAVYEVPKNVYKTYNNHLIQTRHYRAPEVVLGNAWNKAVDIWSIAVIILELIHGYMVFITHCPIDHINQMQKMIGPIPAQFVRCASAKKFDHLFHSDLSLKIEKANKSKIQSKLLNLYFNLQKLEHLNLFYFVSRCLRWKPSERITASEFETHKYFEFIKDKMSHQHKPEIDLSTHTTSK